MSNPSKGFVSAGIHEGFQIRLRYPCGISFSSGVSTSYDKPVRDIHPESQIHPGRPSEFQINLGSPFGTSNLFDLPIWDFVSIWGIHLGFYIHPGYPSGIFHPSTVSMWKLESIRGIHTGFQIHLNHQSGIFHLGYPSGILHPSAVSLWNLNSFWGILPEAQIHQG